MARDPELAHNEDVERRAEPARDLEAHRYSPPRQREHQQVVAVPKPFEPGGELPATFYGGPVVKPGESVSWKTPAMAAGKSYFFMCLIPDPADGVPHAAKGMVLPVSVT